MALFDSTNSRSWQRADITTETLEHELSERHNIAYGDITVHCGDSIRENTIAGFHKALELSVLEGFGKALIVNTSVRQHWALKEARKIDAAAIGDSFSQNSVTVICSPCGDLCNQLSEIATKIDQYSIKLLIINSWEFAASGSRYREKLLFQLCSLVEERELTVLIYSDHYANNSDIGKTSRGKLGKLSAVAAHIALAETESAIEKGLYRPRKVGENKPAEIQQPISQPPKRQEPVLPDVNLPRYDKGQVIRMPQKERVKERALTMA